MNTYVIFKHLHLTLVAGVGLLFLFRAGLLLSGSRRLEHRAFKVLPHVLTVLLLVSGISLATQLPVLPGWVLVKVALLFGFIAVGVVTFKRARTLTTRLTGLATGLILYSYTIHVALTRGAGLPF